MATNIVLDTIQNRRSIRKFQPSPVDWDKMKTVLNAGRWAPSFMNTQPCKFIVVTKPDVKRQVIEALHMPFLGLVYKGQLPYTDLLEAPAIIVVCADTGKDKLHYVEDAACATQNMALAAHSVGLATYWVGIFNHTYVEDAVKKALKVPESVRVISLLPIGVPAESPKKEREPLENMLYYDAFENKTL